ncbi:MAG: FkbM family methyltransferase [Paracoccaceae bacterium]|nr:FkbM family methyltransferase [Paracoccaceae bacterium]
MAVKKWIKRIVGNLIYRLNPGQAERERTVVQPEFHALKPGDIAIDCGANLGAITRILAATGAEVHAFEPNPDAFAVLSEVTAGMPNVHRHQKAVLDTPGRLTLHLHVNYARNPERFSSGSSLIGEKRNVDATRGVEVEVVDLVSFIAALDRPVKLLKIDIEGAEYAILHALLDHGVIDRVEKIFVETHAHAIPSLRQTDAALRARIAKMGLDEKIDLTWT